MVPMTTPLATMRAKHEPYVDRRWIRTKTPFAVTVATPGPDVIVQTYHFADAQQAQDFYLEWKP